MEAAVAIDICLPSLSYPWSLIPPLVVTQLRSTFVTKWRSDRPRTHIAEKDFVLEQILNSPFVIFTLPFVWLPLQSDMGLLGQVCILGWATGPINLTLIILATGRPPHTHTHTHIYIYELISSDFTEDNFLQFKSVHLPFLVI